MLERFLNQYESIETRRSYKSRISKFVQYLDDAGKKISEIDEKLVNNFLKQFKITTRNNYLTAINTYHSYITGNKLNIETIKANTYRPDRNISLQEVQKLIYSAKSKRDKLIIKALFETGIRVQELASLRKESIKKKRNIFYLEFIAKGNKKRVIRLEKELAYLLLSFNSEKKTLFGVGKRQIERILKKLGQDTLSRVVTPHMMRHGFATELMRQGVSFANIQKALGHENITTTMKYLHNKQDTYKWVINLRLE